jgi:hypothetical protein
LVDLLVVDCNLNSSHRGSALVVGLTRLQPGRTRWLFLLSLRFYTKVVTQHRWRHTNDHGRPVTSTIHGRMGGLCA